MRQSLAIMLARAGLTSVAELLEKAANRGEEIAALQSAEWAIDGALLMLRRHSRALQHTSAAFERGQLRGLADDIAKRLRELTDTEGRRAAAH